MPESLHIKIEMLKILQREKESLCDIRGKLSQERITPEEEGDCLIELTKTSERWRLTSRQLEPLPIANMTVETFWNIIQSASVQLTSKDRKTVVRDIEARIREIDDELCKLKYQVSIELDREQSPGQATPEARNTASEPQTPAGATANPTGQATSEPHPTTQRRKQDKGILTCSIPSGATVGDIDMVFLDDKTVRIIIQSKSPIYNFAQMGFMDMKTGNPNRLWRELAMYAGGNGITNQKDSERINNILQAFFKTEQRLLNRRQTFFKIRKQTTSEKKTTSQGKARECPSCQDRHNHFCKECDEETEHCQECHDSLKKHVDLA